MRLATRQRTQTQVRCLQRLYTALSALRELCSRLYRCLGLFGSNAWPMPMP